MCTPADFSAASPGSPRRGISRRTVLLGAAGVGVAATVGVGAVVVPRAIAQDLTIIPTEDWGAAAPTQSATKRYYAPTNIVVHHMATPNVQDTSIDAAYSIAQNCQRWHMDQGWGDSGQQFSVSRGGYVLEGRHGSLSAAQDGSYFIEGIHARGANAETIGIENEGDYTSGLPTDVQWAALVALIAYLCQQYGLDASAISGHRNHSSTSCPGDTLYAVLEDLRADVTTALAGGSTNVAPPAGASPEKAPEDSRDARDPQAAEDGPLLADWPSVEYGQSGPHVLALQRLLRYRWVDVAADGEFGPSTRKAVTTFQGQLGLAADGVADPHTWKHVVVDVGAGDRGEAALGAQELLNEQGADLQTDGNFGQQSQEALSEFQSSWGLTVTGTVDDYTWQALLRG